jgi:hypothetical protein
MTLEQESQGLRVAGRMIVLAVAPSMAHIHACTSTSSRSNNIGRVVFDKLLQSWIPYYLS